MGRWAQSRRRGGSAPPAVTLPPPDAPYIEQDAIFLVVSRNSGPDPNGTFKLYTSLVNGPPWTFIEEKPNTEPTTFGPDGLINGRWYSATEVGGPPNYSGESERSVGVQYTE